MPEVVLVDDAEKTIVERTSAGWPTQAGSTREIITTWKVETEGTRRASLDVKAAQALVTNQAFLALSPPTNAQILAQVRALTRQTNGLLRILLNAYGDVNDT